MRRGWTWHIRLSLVSMLRLGGWEGIAGAGTTTAVNGKEHPWLAIQPARTAAIPVDIRFLYCSPNGLFRRNPGRTFHFTWQKRA